MKIKRIIALLLCTFLITTSTSAFTPFLPEEPESEKTEESNTNTDNTANDSFNNSGNNEDSSDTDSQQTENSQNNPLHSAFANHEVYYHLFEQILDLYVETHLYESTKEEVIDKLIQKLFEDNPLFYKYYINMLLSTLDPYSAYHEAESNFLSPESDQLGFGFMVSEDEDGRGAAISSVIKGSMAEDAGLKAGDKFISVAGFDVEMLPYNVTMTILQRPYHFLLGKNKNGQYDDYNPMCVFVMERNGVRFNVKMQKGKMNIEQFSSRIIDNEGGQVGYVQISSFLGEDLPTKFEQVLKGFEKDGIKRLTIDLRDNSGGSLEYALSMAELFLEENELICYYNDRNLEEPKPIYSTTPKISFDSITVLVNENTASAAELCASILQSHKTAKIIGSKTFGKGIGQTVYALANGDYITITTYEILDSNLYNYNGIGIKPDLEIENVRFLYALPSLPVFNHENYKSIKEGVYSQESLALEKRLEIMGYLCAEDVDGVFDKNTSDSLFVLQANESIEQTGKVTHETVTRITDIINSFKNYIYYEDSQLEVALIVHRSFSQGKRLVAEKNKLSEKNEQAIKAHEDKLMEELDMLDAKLEAEQEEKESEKNASSDSEQSKEDSTQEK